MLNWLKLNLKVEFFNEVTCKKWIELLQWNMNEFWNEITIKNEVWWTLMNSDEHWNKKSIPRMYRGYSQRYQQ